VAYSISYALTWTGGVAIQVCEITGRHPPIAFVYVTAIFMPLQGLYNLVIFLYPKVMSAKRSRRGVTLTWCDAFKIAFMSKGPSTRTLTRGRERHLRKSNRSARKEGEAQPNDEEKCEIEAPNSRRKVQVSFLDTNVLSTDPPKTSKTSLTSNATPSLGPSKTLSDRSLSRSLHAEISQSSMKQCSQLSKSWSNGSTIKAASDLQPVSATSKRQDKDHIKNGCDLNEESYFSFGEKDRYALQPEDILPVVAMAEEDHMTHDKEPQSSAKENEESSLPSMNTIEE